MSLHIPPVDFNRIGIGSRLIVNPKAVSHLWGPRQPYFKARENCQLVVKDKNWSTHASKARIVLSCENPTRRCGHEDLPVGKVDLYSSFTAGNPLLIKVTSGHCHCCGKVQPACFNTLYMHVVCSGCLFTGKAAVPMKFGVGTPHCCNYHRCGEFAPSIAEEEAKLVFNRALKAYRERKL